MEEGRALLNEIQRRNLARGHLLGLLHILIGRRLAKADGTVIAAGLIWRDVAAELKRCRWDPEAVREFGCDPERFPPRDRQRFWYQVIAAAQVGAAEAAAAGDRLALILTKAGYVVGSAPGARS